ncbi:hypothetical protein PT974_07937 [Cladobotryum mycophilum]|uniref:F-box domain-containing protein n=1 Tax=Cladobotryum mycophilum TaxID=491253 RepID=A0ABR0SBY3_9HYPO
MASDKASWESLPQEIRLMILRNLTHSGCSLARHATVCREWQAVIEQSNFKRLKLTPTRLTGLGSLSHRHRRHVKYLWLCIELQEYDCSQCEKLETDDDDEENCEIMEESMQELLHILSTWEPTGNLLLDISVHSPSDAKHYFKHIDFESDALPESNGTSQAIDIHDPRHNWVNGKQTSLPPPDSMFRTFKDIEMSPDFWRDLPEVRVVTGLLLRRQTRRRWEPSGIEKLIKLLPALQEIHYEPWREWSKVEKLFTGISTGRFLKSLIPNQLQSMILFEDFIDEYETQNNTLDHLIDQGLFRKTLSTLGRTLAELSLGLQHLSVSFIADAGYFFQGCESALVWNNLKSLSITSRLLTSDQNRIKIYNLLQAAATAAMKMPRLDAMEIWNGGQDMASVFRYQTSEENNFTAITWRGNWGLPLEPRVIQSWEAVASTHTRSVLRVATELLDPDVVIKSHGDAIHHLRLLNQVVHPVSLWQIRKEAGHLSLT